MNIENSLYPSIISEKNMLSKKVIQEINALSGPQPTSFSWQLFLAWLVIGAAICLAIAMHHLLITMMMIVIIATRQNILGLLVHEQSHRLGFKSKWGDLLVNLFVAYPLLVLTVENYAQVHLSHHKNFFKGNDPDHIRKSGNDWRFPMKVWALVKILLSDLLGLNLIKLINGKKNSYQENGFRRPMIIPSWVRPIYYILAALTITVLGGWSVFFLYWFLPLATVFQVIVRWGAICEHKYNMPNATISESTPLILNTWWEKLLLPNLNFAMHPYHHYFPGIAFNHLPKVHQIYIREGLVNEKNIFNGYHSYMQSLLEANRSIVSNPELIRN